MTKLIADLARRAGAYAIDLALALGIVAILSGVFSIAGILSIEASLLWSSLVVGVVWFLVLTFTHSRGTSLGLSIFGLNLLDEQTAQPIGFARALVRNVVWFASTAVLVGYVSVFLDKSGKNQGWHDRAGRSLIVMRGARTPVMPVLPARDVHAAEWLAAMSLPNGDTDTLTDVPFVRDGAVRAVPRETADRREIARIPQRAAEHEARERAVAEALAPAEAAPAAPPVAPPPVASAPPATPVQVTVPATAPVAETSAHPASASPLITRTSEVDEDADERMLEGLTERVKTPSRLGGEIPAPEPGADVAPEESIEPTHVVAARRAVPMGRRAIATLVWDDGTQFRVYTRTVFGRNPQPVVGAQLAAMRDPSMSLSKTHFEVRPAGNGVSITDLHSTNGVGVRRRGHSTLLVPGEALLLASGDIVEIGERRARVEVTL